MKIEHTQKATIVLENEQEINWLKIYLRSTNFLEISKQVMGKEGVKFLDKLWENL